jgi:hypothetical protein
MQAMRRIARFVLQTALLLSMPFNARVRAVHAANSKGGRMTNSIGKNTCNVPINMDIRERALWGQLAHVEGKPVGQLFREKMLDWARSHRPEVAVAVEDVRRRRAEVIRTGAALFMLILQLGITVDSMVTGDDWQERRPSKGGIGRIMREIRQGKGREIEA